MTRQTAASVDAALSETAASANTHRPPVQRTNALPSVPQRAPRFPDTPWGRLREGRGWSLRELSRQCGVNTAELSRIERGLGPTPDHARALLDVYDEPVPESATNPGPVLTAYAEDYRRIVERGDGT